MRDNDYYPNNYSVMKYNLSINYLGTSCGFCFENDFSQLNLGFYFNHSLAPVPHPHPSARLAEPAPLSSLPGSLRLSSLVCHPHRCCCSHFTVERRHSGDRRMPKQQRWKVIPPFLLSAFIRVGNLHVSDSANKSGNVWRAEDQADRRDWGSLHN